MFSKLNEKRYLMSVLLIVILITFLSVHVSIGGPRLVGKTLEGTLTASKLSARFNQTLNPNSTLNLKITPELKTHHSIQANELTIYFDEALKTNTTYRLTIEGVTDKRRKTSTATLEFKTPQQQLAYLQRRTIDGNDKIVTKTLGKATETILFSGERIGSFTITKNESLLLIQENTNRTLETVMSRVEDGRAKQLHPPKGVAIAISGSRVSNNVLLRTRDISSLQNYLYIYDAESNSFSEITKKDGSSIHAVKAEFASDGNTVIYRDAADGSLVLLDPMKQRDPISFGVTTDFHRYIPDNRGVLFETKPGTYELANSDGKRQTVLDDITISEATILSNLKTVVYIVNKYGLASTHLLLTLKSDNETVVLSDIDYTENTIWNLGLSTNDEFITYQIGKTPFTFDGYRIEAEPKNIETKILNTRGEQIDSINGSQVNWL